MEEDIFTYDIFGEEFESTWMVEDSLWRGIADELEELHYLKGASFIKQLKQIIYYGDFHPVEGETGIFSTGGEKSADYDNLLNAVPAKP